MNNTYTAISIYNNSNNNNILAYYKNFKSPIIYGLIFGGLSSFLISYTPLIFTEIVKILLNDNMKNKEDIYLYIYSFVLYKTSSTFFAGLRGYVFTKYINMISITIKEDIFNRLINLEIDYFYNNKKSEIIELIISDTKKIADLYSIYLNMSIRSLIHLIVVSYILSNKSFKFYIICIILSSLQYIIHDIYVEKNYHQSITETDKINVKERDIITEYVNKILTYRSLGLEEKIKTNLKELYLKNIYLKNIEAYYYGIYHFISGSINGILQTILIIIGLNLNINYKMIYEFTLYISTINGIVKEFIVAKNDFVKNKLPLEKINKLFNEEKHNRKWGDFQYNLIDYCNPDIIFNNISFGYNDELMIFQNLNIKIEKNKITGIKGKSGIGKSTLLKLLLGLYIPKNGKITIDNIEISNFNKKYYYDKIISYVGQEPELLNNTTRSNILIDENNYDRFLFNMLNELYNDIITNGENLSGGQKQRLAICRGIMKKSKILLLDEPSSALDLNNEKKLMKILKNIIDNYNITIIIVSHREETLSLCNNIINLNEH